MENKMGPKMDPGGTPHVMRAAGEAVYPALTEKLLFDKN